jgi:hypothetical protein
LGQAQAWRNLVHFIIWGHHEGGRFFDVVKSSALRKRTSSITRRNNMKGNGAEGKIAQKGKSPTFPKLTVQTQRQLH